MRIKCIKVHAVVRILFAQPRTLLISLQFRVFRFRRNSSAMSAGYGPSIAMAAFQRRKIAALCGQRGEVSLWPRMRLPTLSRRTEDGTLVILLPTQAPQVGTYR